MKATSRIRVGSTNPVKVRATRSVLSKIYGEGRHIEVEGVEVDSGVPEEPWEEQVLMGAENRARAALGRAEMGVGIEAGLFEVGGRTIDVQYCAILDRRGHMTWGHGPGFRYPPRVYEEVVKGRQVGEIMSGLTGIEDIGSRGGSISYLTKGILDRTGLTEEAVLMAMVPRIRPGLYEE